MEAGTARPRVVILGAGFGGLSAAKALGNVPCDVVVIDRRNYHLFQPLLYQVATAGLTPSEIAYPVRAIFRKQANLSFRVEEIEGVDFGARTLRATSGPIPYDYLILAIGAQTNFFGLEGVKRNGFALKDVQDAVAIRNHVLRCFEQAVLERDPGRRGALLTFVVGGGGPTGVEMAGALSELMRLVLKKDYAGLNLADVRVILVESLDRLLAGMPESLGEAARKSLEKKSVVTRLGTVVEDFDGKTVRLKGGETIAASTLIWAAGAKAAPLTEALGIPTGRSDIAPKTRCDGC